MVVVYILLSVLVLALVILAIVVPVRTSRCRKRSVVAAFAGEYAFDHDAAVEHLSGAIRYRTVSYYDTSLIDYSQFEGFHQYLQDSYPAIHEAFKREVVAGYGLLYSLPGTRPELKPILLMGHMDVVPVSEQETPLWQHSPFGGEVADGYVHGRGSLDMKGQLISAMEAVEYLLKTGTKPERGIYLSFGCNEETGSSNPKSSAVAISKLLEQRGVELELVFDEGGDIISGKELGIDGTLAMLGICEKGYLDVELKGTSAGGHSSTPPPSTALGQVCAAAAKVEKAKFPSYFNEPASVMFDSLAPYMDQKNKMLFANRWLFGRMLIRRLCRSPRLAAFMHTTCALTQAYGSMAPNILPQEARIVMNLRIASGESVHSAMDHIRQAAGDQVEVNAVSSMEPSPTSGVDNETYGKMMDLLGEMFPGMIAAPFPMVAATDSRNYYNVCPNVYRFTPYPCMREDHGRMHARDERMEIKSYFVGISFYIRLLEKFCVGQ